MRLPRIVLLGVTLVALLLVWPARAFAQGAKAQSLHVLEIDSDDAEDQAEALTAALRSRARTAPGWVLLETPQSLSMLTAALRCPQRPDAQCLQRISEQLKTDRFVWGVMSKAAGHQVTVELHMWMRGKPDQPVRETYSDNLKDQNDDTLRKLAARIFDRLTGSNGSGSLVVHSGTDGGSVMVDGEAKGQLDHGTTTIALSVGPHVVEVHAQGFAVARQNVNVTGSGNTEVSLPLVPESTGPVETQPSSGTPSKPPPWRKIIAITSIAAGAALLVVGGLEFAAFRSAENDPAVSAYAKTYPSNLSAHEACAQKIGQGMPGSGYDYVCNTLDPAAQSDSLLAGVFGGLGLVALGTGVVLLLTDHGDSPPSDRTAGSTTSFRVVPQVGPRGGTLGVVGQF